MAKKAKNKHAASAAFFQRVNGPDFDIKKATEPRGGGRGHIVTMLRKRVHIQDILTSPLQRKHHYSSVVHRNKRIQHLSNSTVVKTTQPSQALALRAW